MVNDGDTAWHAGFGQLSMAGLAGININSRALGLEIENLNDGSQAYTEIQIESVAYALASWHVTHGYLRWYRHSDVDARKSDPRSLDLASLYRRAARHMVRMLGG